MCFLWNGLMQRLAALLLCLIAAPGAFALTADELALRNVEARGGLDKLHALKVLRLTGRMRIQNDTLELAVVTFVKQPNSIRYEAGLQGLTQVQAFDGTQAWQINPFQGRKDPEKLSADDAKSLGEDAADFTGVLVDYQVKKYKLDYLGTEDIDGTDAHKLRVTRPNGDITTLYLDPDHFLEIRSVDRRIEHGVPVETVTDYGDYEKVAGVYLPFSSESGRKGSADRQKVQFEKVDANPAIADGSFQFPTK
jgi:outer membrane lipoprotein-sorting protein